MSRGIWHSGSSMQDEDRMSIEQHFMFYVLFLFVYVYFFYLIYHLKIFSRYIFGEFINNTLNLTSLLIDFVVKHIYVYGKS